MLNPYQCAVTAGSAVSLGVVQPGFQAAVSVTAGTIFIGAGTAVTTSTGMPISSYALLPGNPVSGSPSTLWAIGGTGGGTVSVGVALAGPR